MAYQPYTNTGSPYSGTASPYQATSPLDMLRKALLGGSQAYQNQNNPGSATAPNPAGQPGQGQQGQQQDGGPNFQAYAGNLVKGILSPPPTSIAGQAIQSLKQLGAGNPMGAGPTDVNGNPMNMYEGNVASPANPNNGMNFGLQPQGSPDMTTMPQFVDPTMFE